jgi:peptidoglycan/LPS O-acetylase OafA/YrhL
VLTVALLTARALVPDTQWRSTGVQAVTSALYVQNWRLANESVDYLAHTNVPTPMQHYWSLSVEEQFYFFWPVLLGLCVLLAALSSRSFRLFAGIGMATILVASLIHSIVYSASNPTAAYFVTPTRMWELAAGGVLALLVARTGSRAATPSAGAVRSALVWIGFAAIGFSAVTYHGDGFPGYRAGLPVLGTALVIAAHQPDGLNPNRLLGIRPLQYLGDISYSVYLWHWPLIVLVPYATGHELRVSERLAVIVAAVLIASVTKRQVEDRFRAARPRASLAVPYRYAAAGMAGVVVLGALVVVDVDRRTSGQLAEVRLAAQSTDPCFAAASMTAGRHCAPSKKVIPGPAVAPTDMSFSYRYDCVMKVPFTGFKSCVFGDTRAHRSVVLIGNSHATQWLPALQRIALAQHFKITTFFTEKCFATTTAIKFPSRAETDNCATWGRAVMTATQTGAFDLVITSERTYLSPVAGGDNNKVFQRGYTDHLKQWLPKVKRMLVIRDVPAPHVTLKSVPDCVAAHRSDPQACSGTREQWLLPDPLVSAVRAVHSPKVSLEDLTNWLCTATTCPGVIGGAMVYFDASHLTATYSASLAPELAPAVRAALLRR